MRFSNKIPFLVLSLSSWPRAVISEVRSRTEGKGDWVWVAALMLLCLFGCGGGGGASENPPGQPPGSTPDGKLPAAPSVEPLPGTFSGEVTLQFKVPPDATHVLFTLDGSSPLEKGVRFEVPVKLIKSQTVRAVAVDGQGRSSPETEGYYEILAAKPPPVPSPGSGASPIARSDSATVLSGEAVLIRVLSNDQAVDDELDPSTVSVVKSSDVGAIVNLLANGDLMYLAPADRVGTDSLSYRVADQNGAYSEEATITVTILPLPEHPYAQTVATDAYVVIEAENYDDNVQNNGHGWVSVTDSNSGGNTLVAALPDTGNSYLTDFAGSSPRLDYRVDFARAGQYHVWIRGGAGSAAGDSVHVGLDGAEIASTTAIVFVDAALSWENQTSAGEIAVFAVSQPGVHTINLWAGHDGVMVDRILLTTSSNVQPDGLGPPQSERVRAGSRDGSYLSVADETPPLNVDFSQEGMTDWVHWGHDSAQRVNRKAFVAAQISDYIVLGTGKPFRYDAGRIQYSWGDGQPTVAVVNSPTEMVLPGLGNGFQIAVAAGKVRSVVKIYVGAWQSLGRIEASLSDDGAPLAAVEIPAPNGRINKVITIAFRSATDNQSLRVRYFIADDYGTPGNIALGAAALTDDSSQAVVATPTIRPSGAFFGSTIDVSAESATPSAIVRYTTDGSDPAFGAIVEGEITLTASANLRVQAFKDGMTPSATSSERFVQGDCGITRIMPLGDSITLGAGTRESEGDFVGYRRKLYQDLTANGRTVDFVGGQDNGSAANDASFDTQHEGHGGWRVEQIADNVHAWITATPADVVLLHIGTNNTSAPGTYTDMSGLSRLLDEVDRFSRDTRIVLSQIINERTPREEIRLYNSNILALASQRQISQDRVAVINMEPVVSYPGDFADDLHLNVAGYNKMADAWRPAVESIMPACVP